MTEPSSSERLDEPTISGPRHFNLQRISLWVAVLGGVLIAIAGVQIVSERKKAKLEEDWVLTRFGLGSPVVNHLDSKFRDEDHDLIADPPAAEKAVRPDRILYSYIAEDPSADPAGDWKPFMDRLAQAVGLPVEYQTFDTVTDQLLAMRHGKLHVTAFNTGSVPRAVNQCGFVPVSAKANPEGDWKIAMKVIVPVKSTVNQVSDLRGQYITFTNPASFSGFRLAIVTLQKEFGMLPGNDYDYRFSTSHNHSIRSVADGELEAACVASDMLSDASAGGTLDEASIREIYTSTAFPAAAFGYVYNLDSDLAAKIGEFLRTASLDATPLDPSGDGSAANTLVATQYKEDWKSVREVDDATGWRHELPERGMEKGVRSASRTEVSVPESGDSSPVKNTVPEGESVETAG